MPVYEPRSVHAEAKLQYEKVTPIGNHVLVEIVDTPVSSVVEVHTPDKSPSLGYVIKTGPDCLFVKPGQYVIIDQFSIRYDIPPNHCIIKETDCLASSNTMPNAHIDYLRYWLDS